MNTNRTAIYLDGGRAWVAEVKDGRARVSSLTAWLSAHPGRGALRALALEQPHQPTRSAAVPWSRPARRLLSSILGRWVGTRRSRDPHHDGAAG